MAGTSCKSDKKDRLCPFVERRRSNVPLYDPLHIVHETLLRASCLGILRVQPDYFSVISISGTMFGWLEAEKLPEMSDTADDNS